jgi:hypothetical protein
VLATSLIRMARPERALAIAAGNKQADSSIFALKHHASSLDGTID